MRKNWKLLTAEYQDWRFAALAAFGVWVVLVATAPGMALVWDEVEYLIRAEQIVSWFRLVFDMADPDGGLNAFAESTIHNRWMFIDYSEGHPAWFAMPIAAGHALLNGLLSPLMAARVGPITVFSLSSGFVVFRLKKVFGTTAAVVAPIALLTFPRLFSHAHYATLDGQLTAWWLMLWAVDSSFHGSTRSRVWVGVLAGLTSATKFTGWLAWLPLVLSRVVRRGAVEWRWLFAVVPIGLFTFWLVNPPLWHSPFFGFISHIGNNLGRAVTDNIPILFLGQSYDTRETLPWYNTLVWLVLATPVLTLLLGLIGVGRCLVTYVRTWSPVGLDQAKRSTSIALVLHWSTLMVVRALPGVPAHDGIRLFLPAFGFWCVLAGVGAQSVWNVMPMIRREWWGRCARAALVAAFLATAFNSVRYYPQGLSHYSLLVGGVRGAARLGMEPTYWWDALDSDVLNWINANTAPGASVAFSSITPQNLERLREWGRLRVEVSNRDEENFQWYVLQNRPGLFNEVERELVKSAQPVYVNYAGRHRNRVPPDLRVPLVMVFSSAHYERAIVGMARDRSGGDD